MNQRRQILLDCDPGIDDAFAIFCALRFADLAAVTTVSGNVPLDHTTRNALHVLELAEAGHVPVHRGADRPLTAPAVFAPEIHGASGLGGTPTPTPRSAESSTSAIDAILDFCASGNATIVATGPLTNVALALQADPSLSSRIYELHWMGGSAGAGNVTPFAEFNAITDPEAVDVVLFSQTPITMYGLDLTRQVRLGAEHADLLASADSPTSRAASEFLRFFANADDEGEQARPMHDPCAVLGATHPDLFDTVAARIVVDVGADEKRGQTTVTAAETGAHRHAKTADARAVRSLIMDATVAPLGA